MKLICNKFDTDPPSCRFYLLATDKEGKNTGARWKVHVDGEVDFKKVSALFKSEHGKDVSEKELKEAHEGA